MSQPSEIKPYYEDEHVTIYNADCLEHPELWTMADVLVTDPPYGIGYKSHASCETIAGDDSTAARDAVLTVWGGKPALVFGSWKIHRPENTRQRLLWLKNEINLGATSLPYSTSDEEIYLLGDWSKVIKPTIGKAHVKSPTDRRGWHYDGTRMATDHGLAARIGHPTPKPIGVMEWLLDGCRPDWVIADPFAGSGSTLVAARNLGRHAIGFELEERYCEIAARRLSQGVFDMGEVA